MPANRSEVLRPVIPLPRSRAPVGRSCAQRGRPAALSRRRCLERGTSGPLGPYMRAAMTGSRGNAAPRRFPAALRAWRASPSCRSSAPGDARAVPVGDDQRRGAGAAATTSRTRSRPIPRLRARWRAEPPACQCWRTSTTSPTPNSCRPSRSSWVGSWPGIVSVAPGGNVAPGAGPIRWPQVVLFGARKLSYPLAAGGPITWPPTRPHARNRVSRPARIGCH
jgi:hypothetical protein